MIFIDENIFYTISFLDGNDFTWEIHLTSRGFVITHNVPGYFVPSFFENKELLLQPNGDLDLISQFLPEPGVVPWTDDLFDFLEALHYNRENEFEEVYLSPSKLIVT
jgi:hypothetical protein